MLIGGPARKRKGGLQYFYASFEFLARYGPSRLVNFLIGRPSGFGSPQNGERVRADAGLRILLSGRKVVGPKISRVHAPRGIPALVYFFLEITGGRVSARTCSPKQEDRARRPFARSFFPLATNAYEPWARSIGHPVDRRLARLTSLSKLGTPRLT